jgi:fructokinase
VDCVVCETDVNAAALAEYTRGAAFGTDSCAYVTVGTGIGAGYISHGSVLGWGGHPEFGHIRLPHDRVADPFPGCCPYHGDCLEGLASGEAMHRRWNRDPRLLPKQHHGWTLEVHYIALALANLTYTLTPQRIILGGGVGARLPRRQLRTAFAEMLAGYATSAQSAKQAVHYIARPHFRHSGLIGALMLARTLSSAD